MGQDAFDIGLVDRGVLAVGRAADITVFDAATVLDAATFDQPARPSVGIEWVVVNGEVAWRQGRPGALAGRLLPRRAAA